MGAVHVLDELEALAAANPDLRFFVANGYHDMATTFFGAEYMLQRSNVSLERVTLRNYAGGHMMYFHPDTFPRMSEDVADFIRGVD